MADENIKTEDQGTDNNSGEDKDKEKTYSFEEVQELLQKEGDRRVSQALEKANKEFQKKLSLSKLDDEARAAAEKEARIEELEQQLRDFQLEKNRSELKSVLGSRGLSAEFADIIAISDDITESQANIDRLDKLFKAAVKAEVERRLGQNSAPKNSTKDYATMTKEQFAKLSLAEIQTLKNAEPELYKALTN